MDTFCNIQLPEERPVLKFYSLIDELFNGRNQINFISSKDKIQKIEVRNLDRNQWEDTWFRVESKELVEDSHNFDEIATVAINKLYTLIQSWQNEGTERND